ncbi:immunoglobulin-like and fibronectin type III domain-containing protein 1 [Stigmatopora argus]
MLKKLNLKKLEREQEREKVVERLCNLKPIQMIGTGAQFELEMSLKDPTSKIFLYKDGVMVPFDSDVEVKHVLRQVGKRFVFSINGIRTEDAGLYQVEVDGVKIFSTKLKIPTADFLVKIQDVKAEEREDAVFECVVSQPRKKLDWMAKNITLQQGDKYHMEVSEDMLVHSLVVKDCLPLDKGIYTAVADLASCSAWLIVEDTGVYFTSGLSDLNAVLDTEAHLVCRLSADHCEGTWFKDGRRIKSTDNVSVVKEGSYRKLVFQNCKEEDSGKYRFEADGRKTEAMVIVEDPLRINKDDLCEFLKPLVVKSGRDAAFEMSYVGREPAKVRWYKEGEELAEGPRTKIERSAARTRLRLLKCDRQTSGEIKIRIQNEFGSKEAATRLDVLDKPTAPLGPVDVVESSASCIEFGWRPPKDDGGSPITNYVLERQQIGRNRWKKLGETGPRARFRDSDVDHGRKYRYLIRAENQQGIGGVMETSHIQAGTKAYPGPPTALKIVAAFKDCIHLAWSAPTNTGGGDILGYNAEKRKKGSNLWGLLNPPDQLIKGKNYAAKDVVEGVEYEFRVTAINISGAGEPSAPSDFVFARDPKRPPGKVTDLKVTDSTYSTTSLNWTKPKVEGGIRDEAKGYFVDIRPTENTEWSRCNSSAIVTNSFAVLGLKSMATYWLRVIANNEGGDGEPQELDRYITAMPPAVKPHFTDRKMKNFVVTRAGNCTRINYNFQASPLPTITWLKDGMPLPKHVTVGNSDTSSRLMIATSERQDSGIYTLILRNIVGQEACTVEIRVTDDPRPPGPVELEENVSSTVTISWTASPDEKKDDRLHYTVAKRDSVKRTWQTLADRLFNNKFTAINILPGRQYKFRVYAKNDMGTSKASESPNWEVKREKGTFSLNAPASKDCNFQAAPAFSVPLKMRQTTESYECYMSCAVTGNPKPSVTWYRNHVSINADSNYYVSNTCGVCSMAILKVGPKDSGEYVVMAENALGRVQCSTKLLVKGAI